MNDEVITQAKSLVIVKEWKINKLLVKTFDCVWKNWATPLDSPVTNRDFNGSTNYPKYTLDCERAVVTSGNV